MTSDKSYILCIKKKKLQQVKKVYKNIMNSIKV